MSGSRPTTFYLIRHGMTDLVNVRLCGRTPGISLNELGRGQAHALADALDGVSFAAIYSSPIERAMETAQALALRRELEVRAAPEFVEVDFGSWTYRTFEDIDRDPEWKRFNAWRSVLRAPGGGESMLDVAMRCTNKLDVLAREHPGARVALVTHADPVRAVIAHSLAMPQDFLMRLEISPASATIVEWGEWGPRLLAVNRLPGWPDVG
jgi:broad specificity phosphatase PhoE